MAGHQCWFKTDGRVIGPISSVKLRELAQRPDHFRDADLGDNEQWIPASKVKGLLDPPILPPMIPPVPSSDPSPSRRTEARGDDGD